MRRSFLGEFTASAANETGHTVSAACFYLRADFDVTATREIEEAVWVSPDGAGLPIARQRLSSEE